MKSNKYITVFATGVLLLLASRAGYAIPIAANASFGFVPSGSVTISPGGNVASAVTIFLPATNIVNTILTTYLGSPNNFCDIAACGFNGGPAGSFLFMGDTVTVPATLDATFVVLPNIVFSSGTAPGSRYTFHATSGFKLTSAPNNLELDYLGTFSDSGGTYLNGPASVSFALTQTGGPTGTINYSAVFATPPAFTGAPEPATMAIMGSGLIGLGLIGRKRLARK